MRSPSDVYADLEGDRRAREAEIALIEKLIPDLDVGDQDSLKRSLVLLIYSHVEGYCKFALLTYVQWINSAGLKCGQVTYPLVAASLSKVFSALRDPNSKHDFFRTILPMDASLHLSARDQAFVEKYDLVISHSVEIPDKVVDTKSNVNAEVLMKILFQLGMDYREVAPHSGNLNKLLGIRNAIAHGDRLKVPREEEIADFKATAGAVMSFLQEGVYSALQGATYLRPAAVAA